MQSFDVNNESNTLVEETFFRLAHKRQSKQHIARLSDATLGLGLQTHDVAITIQQCLFRSSSSARINAEPVALTASSQASFAAVWSVPRCIDSIANLVEHLACWTPEVMLKKSVEELPFTIIVALHSLYNHFKDSKRFPDTPI